MLPVCNAITNHYLYKNNKKILDCNEFRPLPNITWNKLNGELPLTRLKDFKSQEADYGKALIIENVRSEDAGVYECRAQHLVHQIHVIITGNSPIIPDQHFKIVKI